MHFKKFINEGFLDPSKTYTAKEAIELISQGWFLYRDNELDYARLLATDGSRKIVRLNLPDQLLKKNLIRPSQNGMEAYSKVYPGTESKITVWEFNPPTQNS